MAVGFRQSLEGTIRRMEKPNRKVHRTWVAFALFLGSIAAPGCTVSVDVGNGEVAETSGLPIPGEPGPLDAMFGPYDIVRRALLEDHLDGVGEAAASIRDAGTAFMEGSHDGMPAEKATALEALVPALISAAEDLAQAGDLAAARDSFWALTEALVTYRELFGNDSLRVAYCPMAEKSWLQPDEEIGNPYYGQSMAGCGGFVDGEEGGGS